MITFRTINEEVLYTAGPFTALSGKDIEWLKEKASHTERGRIRLCLHKDTDDALQHMVIVHARGDYVRPHKHLGRGDNMQILEGRLLYVSFNEDGAVSSTLQMGDPSSGDPFQYRTAEVCFHTQIIQSEVVVFSEVTTGPFRREEHPYAPWSPPVEDKNAWRAYLAELADRLGA